MEFMVRHEGHDLGPYSEDEIRTRLIAGRISLSDLGRSETGTEWTPLSAFEQFATSYRQPQGPPPIPIPTVANLTVPPLPQAKGPAQRFGGYTAATLQPDERPLHQTNIHWIALSGPIVAAVLCVIVFVPIAIFAAWKNFYWAWILVAIPAAILVSADLTIRTSELVITDRRVLIKVGFIRRRTFEMFISKIESVAVYQSMLGRLFNYGTVEIRGTGGSSESFATIAAPLPFRDAIQLVQTGSERR
jgi:hypothetical protein